MFFSDFEDPPKKTVGPSPSLSRPSLPPPPKQRLQQMTRNDFGNYATKLTNFVCGGKHKRGEGKCKTWETKIDASGLSEKMRGILNLNPGDLVSLSQYREWANMKFERGFKEGPGKADKKWQVGSTISWSSYLRLIVEVICFIDASSRSGSPQLVPPQVRGEIEDKEAPNLYISSPSAQLPAPPSTSSTSAPLPPPQSKSSTYHVQVARDPWASQPQQTTASPTPLDPFSPSSPVKTSEGADLLAADWSSGGAANDNGGALGGAGGSPSHVASQVLSVGEMMIGGKMLFTKLCHFLQVMFNQNTCLVCEYFW